MPKSTAVLLLGPMRAGKTTAASHLSDEYGFRRYSLADSLKQLHNTVTGTFEKDREWLQTVGASCRAVFGEDFWADRLIEQLKKEKPDCFVVDDVRYENELSKLYNFARNNYHRVVVIVISISMDTQIRRGAEIPLLSHESEKYSRSVLNSASYDKQTGVGLAKVLGTLYVPIIDGSTPLDTYFAELEDELRFDYYDKLSRAYRNWIPLGDEEFFLGTVEEE